MVLTKKPEGIQGFYGDPSTMNSSDQILQLVSVAAQMSVSSAPLGAPAESVQGLTTRSDWNRLPAVLFADDGIRMFRAEDPKWGQVQGRRLAEGTVGWLYP